MSNQSSGLSDLYRDVVLDHSHSPRNKRQLAEPTVAQRGTTPICGDEVEVALRIEGDRVAEIGFQGQGCVVSQASASMMTEAMVGRTLDEAIELAAEFKRMMVEGANPEDEKLGDAEVLAGVRRFPARVKCATLAWNTVQEAIELYGKRTA